MRVRIYAARHQVLPAAVEDFGAGGNIKVFTDGFDHAVGTIDVGAITFIMGNNGGATDQQRHSEFLAGIDRLVPVLDVLLMYSVAGRIPVSAVRNRS
ncbi:hypothetical protein D3C87_1116490 [compost metagenome]